MDDISPLPGAGDGEGEVPDLSRLLDADPEISANHEALRSIVSRHDHRRRRALATALAVVAVAGPIGGYVVGAGHRSSAGTVVNAGSASPATTTGARHAVASSGAPAGSSGSGSPALGVPSGFQESRLFLRNTFDRIRIRVYEQAFPKPARVTGSSKSTTAGTGSAAIACPAVGAQGPMETLPPCGLGGCFAGGQLVAEVSDDQVAGATAAAFARGTPSKVLDLLGSQVVGAGQPTTIGVVFVQVGARVTMVRLTPAGGGHDEMAPVNGFAVLALSLSGSTLPSTTVDALDASGKVLASMTLLKTGVTTALPGCEMRGGSPPDLGVAAPALTGPVTTTPSTVPALTTTVP